MMRDTAAAPTGFKWKCFNDVLLLKPVGWLDREVTVRHTLPSYDMYAMSPEKFSEIEAFETGFTIQIIRNADRFRGLGAARLAGYYLTPLVDVLTHENALILDTRTFDELVRTVVRYVDVPTGSTAIVVHKFVIANTKTEDVHIFTFECPKLIWEEMWSEFGEPILSNLRVAYDIPANEPKY